MDPLTAFGLACNILTVVDAAVKCGKTIAELYDSSSGYTHEMEDLRKAFGDLEAIEHDLKASQSQIPATESGKRMQHAAADCARIAHQINEILVSCGAQRPNSWGSAIKASLIFATKKPEIRRLLDELNTSSNKLALLVATTTQSDVSEIRSRLQQTHTDHQVSMGKLDNLKAHLDRATAPDKILEAIKAINTTSHEAMESITQYLLVQSIRSRYPAAKARFESVSQAELGTFSWILEDPDRLRKMEPELHVSFTEWLASGLGVFHIAGKPGAGKSTLMKLLVTHKETKRLLEEWAGEKDLLFANFFIWRLGGEDQKTWDGMVGSLLYDIVRQVPSITKLLFTNHWQREKMQLCLRANYVIDLSEAEIREAFEKLINDSEVHEKYRICFGIDGLDEFDEPTSSYWDLAQRIKNWTEGSSGNIKLCVSSREYPSIEQVFSEHQRIRLHRLTEKDILQLSMGRLNDNPLFRSLSEKSGKGSRHLFERITKEAEGVFLWVLLLLKLIEEELAIRTETISIQHLHNIIDSAPKELEDFIARIFQTIPSHCRANATMVLGMALRMNGLPIQPRSEPENLYHPRRASEIGWKAGCLSILGVSLYFDPPDNPNSLRDQLHVRCRIRDAIKLVNSWCQGLLTIEAEVLRFSHRSIPELLQKIFRTQEAPNITDEKILEGILNVFLAEARVPESMLPFRKWERTSLMVLRDFVRDCPAQNFSILHSIEDANERDLFGPRISDASWIRRVTLRSIETLVLDDVSILIASARFGSSQYCQWKVENHLRFPDDSQRMEAMLAFATCGALELSNDKSDFKRILDSCVRKWKASPCEPIQTFPWNVTWLDFIKYFLIELTPMVATQSVGWTLFEYWLELGLNPTLVIFLSRPWKDTQACSNQIFMHTAPRPPEFQRFGNISYGQSLISVSQLHQSLWEFAFAEQRGGRLTVRDLVVFYSPANTPRLLELIDRNVIDNPTEVPEIPSVTTPTEDHIWTTEYHIWKTAELIEDRKTPGDEKTQISDVAEANMPLLMTDTRQRNRREEYLAILVLFFASVAFLQYIF